MQIFPTRMCNVTAMTSLEITRLLANGPIVPGAEGEFPGNCSVSYLSLAMVALEETVGGA